MPVSPATAQVYRATGSRILGAATMAFGGLGVLSLALADPVLLVRFGALLVLLATLGWAAYWRPRLVLDDAGVTVHNVFTRVQVPWGAIVELHSRYGLLLETPRGNVRAWAVPAPVGRDRARGAPTEAATLVRQHLERLRAHGEAPPRADRRPGPTVADRLAIGLVSTLLVLSVIGVLLPIG